MSLNENIKIARKKKKLTQKELASLIGVSHNTISDWESGNHKPDADTVMQLCRVLDVDANFMFDYKYLAASADIKQILKEALSKYFDGDDLTEENFNKFMKFIETNKEFIIEKEEEK